MTIAKAIILISLEKIILAWGSVVFPTNSGNHTFLISVYPGPNVLESLLKKYYEPFHKVICFRRLNYIQTKVA